MIIKGIICAKNGKTGKAALWILGGILIGVI
jgi:hypothetical protein